MTGILLELDLTRGVLETPPASPVAAFRARHLPTLRELVGGAAEGGPRRRTSSGGRPSGRSGGCRSRRCRICGRRWRTSGRRARPRSRGPSRSARPASGTVPYYLATAFDEIWVQPSGELGVTGVSVQAIFVRGALDKAGVIPQFGKRREYKTAADTFTEKEMTGPAREMASRLAESAFEQIVEGIAVRRRLDTAHGCGSSWTAHRCPHRPGCEAGWSTGSATAPTCTTRWRSSSARPHGCWPSATSGVARRTLQDVRKTPPLAAEAVVAVVRVSVAASRVGRNSGGPLGGPGSGSDTVGAALRAVADDEKVKAVVLRVDSPGGSYVASDAIRNEVLRLRSTGRPVIASMGSVAASGGYFVAMPADVIVAQPGTITGSIGVLTGKGVVRDALGRIGISQEAVSRGRERADVLGAGGVLRRAVGAARGDPRPHLRGLRRQGGAGPRAARGRAGAVGPRPGLDRRRRARAQAGRRARRLPASDSQLACNRAGLDRDEIALAAVPHRNLLDQLLAPAGIHRRPGRHDAAP